MGLQLIISDCKVSASDINGNKNEMTFGQIVSILFLSSILFTFREAYDSELLSSMHTKYTLIKDLSLASIDEWLKDKTVKMRSILTSSQASEESIERREMTGNILLRNIANEPVFAFLSLRRVDTKARGRIDTNTIPSPFGLQRRHSLPNIP